MPDYWCFCTSSIILFDPKLTKISPSTTPPTTTPKAKSSANTKPVTRQISHTRDGSVNNQAAHYQLNNANSRMTSNQNKANGAATFLVDVAKQPVEDWSKQMLNRAIGKDE